MRKIILNLAVTLDSYIEGPKGEYDWCIMDDDMNFDGFLSDIDTVLYGRKSFELFGSQDPETFGSEPEKDLFRKINVKEKYVFSTTLTPNECLGATLINSNLEKEVHRIKELPGESIWLFGGASLITSFVNANLIDEYHLAVHPVILGSGKPLFVDIKERLNLKLIKTQTTKSGVIVLHYQPQSK